MSLPSPPTAPPGISASASTSASASRWPPLSIRFGSSNGNKRQDSVAARRPEESGSTKAKKRQDSLAAWFAEGRGSGSIKKCQDSMAAMRPEERSSEKRQASTDLRSAPQTLQETVDGSQNKEDIISEEDASRGKIPKNGLRILLIGSSDIEIQNKLINKGAAVIPASKHKLATHICVLEDEIKVVTKEWLKAYCDNESMCDKVSDIEGGSFEVDKVLPVYKEHHQLFLCHEDFSEYDTLLQYAQKRKGSLQEIVLIPGGNGQVSLRTNFQLKCVVVGAYILVRCLQGARFSLLGHFNATNFILDDAKMEKNIRFSNLPSDALQNSSPENDKLDMDRFDEMIRQEVFSSGIVPHDLNIWLSLLNEDEFKELLPEHVSLMDDLRAGEKLGSWYDTLDNLESKKSTLFSEILGNLRSYNNWKGVIGDDGNSYLLDALKYAKEKNIFYSDDAFGLLKLLRNCRQHDAKEQFRIFVVIVAQHWPDLISDLQKQLYKKNLL